jgi:carbohydrate diacid regulator
MSAYIVDYGERLESFASDIQHDIERTLGCTVFIGIGDLATDQVKYWHSYQEALRAISWMAFSKGEGICAFSSICKGILITSLPTEEAQEFVDHVFGDLPNEQIESFFKIFYAYVRHNGSIKHCSEELFIHKNTLQERLNRIAKKTGYNPRQLSDFTVLDNAFMLWKYLKLKNKLR